jgi:membrane dipeptidase
MGNESAFKPASDEAKKFIQDNIAIDNLNVVGTIGAWNPESVKEYFTRAQENGITAMSLTAAYDPYRLDFLTTYVGRIQGLIADMPNVVSVQSVADIENAHKNGKLGVMFCTQGSECLDGNPDNVGLLSRLGFTSIALIYNLRYQAGDGRYMAEDIGGIGGLTLYGRAVIDQLVRHGIPLDFSHLSKPASYEAFEYLQKNAPEHPIIYSHSSPEAVCEYPYRNVTDEEIKMVAKTGGFMAISIFSIMVAPNGYGPIKMERVLEIIDHIVKLVGIDHVALGSDDSNDNAVLDQWGASADLYPDKGWVFERCTYAIENKIPTDVWEPAKTWPAIYDAMKEHGYSDEDCAKLFGGNTMRVYRQCEQRNRQHDYVPSKLASYMG